MQPLQRSTISFEFFPPKTSEGKTNLMQSAQQLAMCNPHFFSVTFGAGGSTREGTLEVVKMLKENTKVLVAPHLSCIGYDRNQIIDLLMHYQSIGVKRIVAIRGDLPSGMGNAGEFRFASDLVALIREVTGDYFYIEVAAYPEFHPQALSADDDLLNLKRKYEAGANSAITQYFFNTDAYFYYLDSCSRLGINMPVVPGIMPITQFTKLVRFSDMCGAEIPRWLRRRLESFGDDVESIREFGKDIVSSLCERLLMGGAPGLHFYTLNRAEESLQILQALNIGSTAESRFAKSVMEYNP